MENNPILEERIEERFVGMNSIKPPIQILGIQPNNVRKTMYVLGNYRSGSTKALSEAELCRMEVPEDTILEIMAYVNAGYSLSFGGESDEYIH